MSGLNSSITHICQLDMYIISVDFNNSRLVSTCKSKENCSLKHEKLDFEYRQCKLHLFY